MATSSPFEAAWRLKQGGNGDIIARELNWSARTRWLKLANDVNADLLVPGSAFATQLYTSNPAQQAFCWEWWAKIWGSPLAYNSSEMASLYLSSESAHSAQQGRKKRVRTELIAPSSSSLRHEAGSIVDVLLQMHEEGTTHGNAASRLETPSTVRRRMSSPSRQSSMDREIEWRQTKLEHQADASDSFSYSLADRVKFPRSSLVQGAAARLASSFRAVVNLASQFSAKRTAEPPQRAAEHIRSKGEHRRASKCAICVCQGFLSGMCRCQRVDAKGPARAHTRTHKLTISKLVGLKPAARASLIFKRRATGKTKMVTAPLARLLNSGKGKYVRAATCIHCVRRNIIHGACRCSRGGKTSKEEGQDERGQATTSSTPLATLLHSGKGKYVRAATCADCVAKNVIHGACRCASQPLTMLKSGKSKYVRAATCGECRARSVFRGACRCASQPLSLALSLALPNSGKGKYVRAATCAECARKNKYHGGCRCANARLLLPLKAAARASLVFKHARRGSAERRNGAHRSRKDERGQTTRSNVISTTARRVVNRSKCEIPKVLMYEETPAEKEESRRVLAASVASLCAELQEKVQGFKILLFDMFYRSINCIT